MIAFLRRLFARDYSQSQFNAKLLAIKPQKYHPATAPRWITGFDKPDAKVRVQR
jgi:hypothetical protein